MKLFQRLHQCFSLTTTGKRHDHSVKRETRNMKRQLIATEKPL